MTPVKLTEAVQMETQRPSSGGSSRGRVPYRRHRYAVAAFFGVDEAYIWPDALDRDEIATASESEIVAVYPHRWAVSAGRVGALSSSRPSARSGSSSIRGYVPGGRCRAPERLLGDEGGSRGRGSRILLGDPGQSCRCRARA